ncbi:hypothetical protein CYMTET_20943, partial [Cymbomonas tetramitiformis]
RVLKPGGRYLFIEHVLSETDEFFAMQQRILDPLQVMAADGCHLNRRTLQTIKAEGFSSVDAEYFELDGFSLIKCQIAGIATA